MRAHLLGPNDEKQLTINTSAGAFERWPIQTHVIQEKDDILDICQKYAAPHLQQGDQLFLSERVVAITQGRSYKIDDIHPRKLATFLSRFVHKTPAGIGLGSPWTMELALREVGQIRILFAASIAAITKPFGVKGLFYRIAGRAAAAIDGPCDYTLPPYNRYATLGPKDPHTVAAQLASALQYPVVIMDANDLGVDILGTSPNAHPPALAAEIVQDNPLGQGSQRTPLCIVRPSETGL